MQKPAGRKLLGNVLLLLTAMIWGMAFAVQRVGAGIVEPGTFNASRMSLAALTVGLVLLFSRGRGRETAPEGGEGGRKENLRGGIACGCFLAAACMLQQKGLAFTTAGKAGFIPAMYILIVPVIRTLVFRQKNPPAVRPAVALGMLGMYLLCMTDGLRLTRGDALISVCALLYSGHILCCDHFSKRGDPLRIAGVQFLTCAVLCGAVAALTEHPQPEQLRAAAANILYCGVLSGGVGYTLQMVAQGFTEPTTASLLMSLESVFAALSGALLLGERMRPRELLGCLVLFAAVVVVQLPERRR